MAAKIASRFLKTLCLPFSIRPTGHNVSRQLTKHVPAVQSGQNESRQLTKNVGHNVRKQITNFIPAVQNGHNLSS